MRQFKEVSFDGASTSAKASDVSKYNIYIIGNIVPINSKLRTIELYGK